MIFSQTSSFREDRERAQEGERGNYGWGRIYVMRCVNNEPGECARASQEEFFPHFILWAAKWRLKYDINTCVLNRNARAMSNTHLKMPSFGIYSTIRYVSPKSGISTSSALDAFRCLRVSAVLADLNFVMSTWIMVGENNLSHWCVDLWLGATHPHDAREENEVDD
jgi:hypothetical protein